MKKLSEQRGNGRLKAKWSCGATFDKVIVSIESNARSSPPPSLSRNHSPNDNRRDGSSPEAAGTSGGLTFKDVSLILGEQGLMSYFHSLIETVDGGRGLWEVQFAVMHEASPGQPVALGKVKRGKFRGGSGEYGDNLDGEVWGRLGERVDRDFRA